MKTFIKTYTSKCLLDDEKLKKEAKHYLSHWYKEEKEKTKKDYKYKSKPDFSLDSFIEYLDSDISDASTCEDWIEDDYLAYCECYDEDFTDEIDSYKREIIKPIYDEFMKNKKEGK